MPRFFESVITVRDNQIILSAENSHHISRVLRMNIGDIITICDGLCSDYISKIIKISSEAVVAELLEKKKCENEPSVKVHIFQGIAKGDKMDAIIQKSVELGVFELTPFFSSRCIVQLDAKDAEKKRERWQKIAFEAAMQSERGIVPRINSPVCYNFAIKELTKCNLAVILYECEDKLRFDKTLLSNASSIGIAIGPEGGFSAEEVAFANQSGAKAVTLGKRILRTETVSSCAISIIMHITGNM